MPSPDIVAVSIAMLRVMKHVFGRSFFSDCNVQYVYEHSVGEYKAQCAVGALTLESALKLPKVPGDAMHEASLKCKGGMVALLVVEIGGVEGVLESS